MAWLCLRHTALQHRLGCPRSSAYPNQPIKVIVPFLPSGGTAVVTRLLVDKLRASTNWTLMVDNKAGAGGNIGLDAVAKSKADGYTLGMGQTAKLAINPSLYTKMTYDAAKDFVPVAPVSGQPVVLVVNANSPFKTLADLVAAATAGAPDGLLQAPGSAARTRLRCMTTDGRNGIGAPLHLREHDACPACAGAVH